MIQCSYCGETKLDKMAKSCRIKSGYKNICKQCHNSKEKERRSKLTDAEKQHRNKKHWKNRQQKIANFSLDEVIIEWARRFRNRSLKNIKNQKWVNTRKNLSLDFLVQQAKNALQKFPYMVFLEAGDNKWATASVDRIDSSKGYSEDNVRVVPFWLNSAMMNMSDKNFKMVIEHYYNNFIKGL